MNPSSVSQAIPDPSVAESNTPENRPETVPPSFGEPPAYAAQSALVATADRKSAAPRRAPVRPAAKAAAIPHAYKHHSPPAQDPHAIRYSPKPPPSASSN